MSDFIYRDDLVELALDERKQVRVDRFGLRCRHAVRKAFVGLQRAVLQQLG